MLDAKRLAIKFKHMELMVQESANPFAVCHNLGLKAELSPILKYKCETFLYPGLKPALERRNPGISRRLNFI